MDAHLDHPTSSLRRLAQFETCRRLIACLVNEQLIAASVRLDDARFEHSRCLRASARQVTENSPTECILVGLNQDFTCDAGPIDARCLDASDLSLPILIIANGSRELGLKPGNLFETMSSWFPVDIAPEVKSQIKQELTNSAENQGLYVTLNRNKIPTEAHCDLEAWFRLLANYVPELTSSLIDWERAIVTGHPIHPMHRTCLAQPPLQPLVPTNLPDLLSPEIIFIAVPRSKVLAIGPFEAILKPLLRATEVDLSKVNNDNQIVTLCLARQLPAIQKYFGAEIVPLSAKQLRGEAQASLRTISLPASSTFPYHLKLALACKINSALRTVSPWTACVGREISTLLEKVLPGDIWVMKETAAVTGSQSDFDEAKHLSVVLRESPEDRAYAEGQALIPLAALSERSVEGTTCHAIRLFGLTDDESKLKWLRSYVRLLLSCTLLPLVEYGIGLEAHGQNILARFNLESRSLVGFAVRDFGGLRIHMPTLRQRGFDITSSPPGNVILVDDINEVYDKARHTIFNSHLNQLVLALGMRNSGGWAVVREELQEVLAHAEQPKAKSLYNSLIRERVSRKCFMRMKLKGLFRDYIYMDTPNVLLQ